MGVASSARLLGAAVVWRRAGVRSAGMSLARALTGDEQERTLAGIGLVQAGPRSCGVIATELAEHGPSPTMVRVLADIGGDRARDLLRRIAAGSDDCARLARRILDDAGSPPRF